MPTIGGGDDFVWIGGPDERLWLLVVVGDEAIDGGLEIDEALKTARLRRRLVRITSAKSRSTLSKRGRRSHVALGGADSE
jgi:hypothetical protein